MKDYLLFMDVSGDVDKSYVEQGKVKLLPMEFVISGEAYTYTDGDDGMDAVKFYEGSPPTSEVCEGSSSTLLMKSEAS